MVIDRWTMSLRWQRQIGEIRGLIKQGAGIATGPMESIWDLTLIVGFFVHTSVVSPHCLFTQTRRRDVSVNIIELWCRGSVILAFTLGLSINIHLLRHPTNGEGIQFASIHSKLFCSMVLLTSTIKQNQCGGTPRPAGGWQWILSPLL